MKSTTSTPFLCLIIIIKLCLNLNTVYAQDKVKYPTLHRISLEKGNKRTLLLLPPELNTVEISKLEVGEKYLINLNKDDVVNACNPEISMYDENNNKISFFSSFEFTAYSDKLTLNINPDCVNPYNSRLSVYLSIGHRGGTTHQESNINNNYNRGLPGPLVGSSGINVTDLITDILVGDPNIQVSNISSIGGPEQFGKFESGKSSIGMESGILITSGSCSLAGGPNESGGATGGGGGGSDPDLANISKGGPIFDAGGVQFDFIPVSSKLQFNYVFASEEYEEYTCSAFNDVFGLFLTDVDSTQNIALIPGTNISVGINTVNQGAVGSFGNIANCTLPLGSLSYSGFYVSNPSGSPDVQYDGFTKVLTAEATVIPCKKYHLKMVVGDAGDSVFDSGVFIEAKSLNTGSNYYTSVFTGNSQSDTLYESCNDGYIHFKRANNINFDEDIKIPINIDSNSTATEGVDYDNLPPFITIPAGEEEYVLPIHVHKDLIQEGIETIILNENNACSNGSNNITFYIKDTYAISIDTSESYICVNDSVGTISAKAVGGIGNYTYVWSNGSTNQSIQILTSDTLKYSVTVTDDCGRTASTELSVKTAQIPTAQIEGFGTLCPFASGQDLVYLNVKFTGFGPWNLNYFVNGIPQVPILNITSNPYILHATKPGNYTIESVEGKFGCVGPGVGVAVVDTTTLAMLTPVKIDTLFCFGDTIVINNQQISIPTTLDFLSQENNQCVHYHYNINYKKGLDTLANICTGGFINIANSNFSAGGYYVIHLPQVSGCDSIISLTILEHPVPVNLFDIAINKGSIFKGIKINNDTTIIEYYKTQFNCDSIVVTTVTVLTATQNQLSNNDIRISPNPANNQISISWAVPVPIKEWSIIDVLGFKVMTSNKEAVLPIIIDISSLTNGYYWWVGQNDKQKTAVSFIKMSK